MLCSSATMFSVSTYMLPSLSSSDATLGASTSLIIAHSSRTADSALASATA